MADVQAHSGSVPSDGIKQPYHLVDPSPWPLLSAFAGGLLATGLVLQFHGHGWYLLAAGLLAVLGCMWGWWRDVLKESVVQKAHSPVVKIGLRYGMSLFIASEVMFFAAFFWAFFDASLFTNEAIQYTRVEATGGTWPPKGITPFNPFDLPFLMTVILLLSGTTVTWAHHEIIEGRQKQAVTALAITVALGVLFTGFQLYEYSHATFAFNTNVYSSTFFMATGFHGLHVFIGTVFLAVCLFRAMKGHFTPKSHFGFEAAAWYWHFVDVVWLFLFVAIYWWGAGGKWVAH
ncbi:cytochrome c oxidase subunit 3 [Aerophototrophica crusticola]|uniref:Cytochrome c oxidase subunit 3 n=1 Tax=Aerophototrophica crusticola TaxID=1709002 RepID=A0A858R3Z6_9PROT|nr:cytochrome c oxidase subunit 3 [Rhodospirillaceae bacterium B3]